ncbi:MAG TPA: recombinase family protein [Actinophytocola sp.]|uniref:recombinase family protein n=1 Tax=Actinophytocola sp. TaxID=1872138 RepID=UPI002DBD0B48|nr:recombinase family protein [Actinophytocola sp.]HEU5469080.1 recombinase family protein [Actinophytocola sp.]
MSTQDFQDWASSYAWQRHVADDLIAGSGRVVADFFDIGQTRRTAWADRPQAARLLAALARPDRGFDAVVVGEYERAFCGDQLIHLLPIFAEHGVAVWLPETHGPINPGDPTHAALVLLLGAQSQREVQRSRFRVLAAMRAQTVEQGRYLGGRPPYGYRLVDAGPHPNAAHARWGRRLHRLEPDPAAADHVRWIFAQRLAGHSASRIAHDLNLSGVRCPSQADPDRNRHRTGAGWTLRTVATILGNPRYTGRQVWNRHHSDHAPTADLPGRPGEWAGTPSSRSQDWVISKTRAHPALVSEDDFLAAQAINATPTPADGTSRTYALVGLLRCGICSRRMDSHWVHDRPGYRCRHGHTSAKPTTADKPKTLYLREDVICARIAQSYPHLTTPGQSTKPDPAELAHALRERDIMILCDTDSCALDMRSSTGHPQLQLIT